MRKIVSRFQPAPMLARKIAPVAPARRVRLGLDHLTPRKAFDTTGEVDRHDPSRAPPAVEPGYSEYRCNPHRYHLRTTRALRLWSNTEVK